MLVLFAVATVIAPIAFWQFGSVGLVAVVLYTLSLAGTHWAARRSAEALSQAGRAVASIIVAGGIRMGVPLAVALVVVVLDSDHFPVASLLLLVPLYLGLLVTETIGQLRSLEVGGSLITETVVSEAVPLSEPRG